MRAACTIAATIALGAFAYAQQKPQVPVSIFNGEDLSGWEGNRSLWSVVDGVITGVTEAEGDRKIDHNTFLIWKGGEVDDFELTLKARITGDNNSGIQYRSNVIDPKKSIVAGYQMDIHPRQNFIGMLYEERGRGILAQRGSTVRVSPKNKKQTIATSDATKEIDLAQWNEYTISARGNRLVHKINGDIACTVLDDDPDKRSLQGVVALQLHAGAPMKLEAKDIVLKRFTRTRPTPPKKSPRADTGSDSRPEWIWPHAVAKSGEVAYFRKAWKQRKRARAATLIVTCDDAFTAYLNGKEVGAGDSWKQAYHFDGTAQLVSGLNVIAVRGTSAASAAGLAAQLTITHEDGSTVALGTDVSWFCSASGEEPKNWKSIQSSPKGWQRPHVHGPMGIDPWGDVFGQANGTAPGTRSHRTLPGFALEKIYEVPNHKQGSWVALTAADHGRMVVSDQRGSLYYVTPPRGDKPCAVEKIDLPIGHANGLLWAFDSLYVCVNGPGIGGNDSGLYRLVDTSGDKQLDTITLLKKFNGSGEHGPHAVVLGPDPLSVYVVAGKHTELPAGLARSCPPQVWGDDQLLPRLPDGTADGGAPGGWVCKLHPEGIDWVLHSIGFNNPYDIAFNHHGDLFACDADTQGNMGSPWYRPARLYHVPKGGEFGWRGGSGNWPDYYPDTLPATLDIGSGSPTGIAFGYGAKFPARYQQALFVCDWSSSTIYAAHLNPDGSTYNATSEEFIAGTDLRLTDIAIGGDGAMYFTSGGHGSQSALWRVTYSGDEKTTPAARRPTTPETEAKHALRKRLGGLHGVSNLRVAPTAWPHLSNPDRFVRFAARTAIEHQDPNTWLAKFVAESDTDATLQAAVALARTGTRDHQQALLEKLGSLDFGRLTNPQKIDLLRAYGLRFIRLGGASAATKVELAARLLPHFPSGDDALDAELCRILVYLGAPDIAATSVALMAKAKPDSQGMLYATFLRNLDKEAWTPHARAQYFDWFEKAATPKGGANYPQFLKNIEKNALLRLGIRENQPPDAPSEKNE